MIGTAWQVVRSSAGVGLSEYWAAFTLRSWMASWLLRVVTETTFYALIGRLLGSDSAVEFILIGNVALAAAAAPLFVIPSTSWVRRMGTLPLIEAAPAGSYRDIFGRNMQVVLEGSATAAVALVVVSLLFGFGLPLSRLPAAVVVLLVISLTTYCLAMPAAALVLRFTQMRFVLSNVARAGMAVICGVNVPVEYFALPVQVVAQSIPLTHGVEALRTLLDGGSYASVAADAGIALVLGAAWAFVGGAVLARTMHAGRRMGTLELVE